MFYLLLLSNKHLIELSTKNTHTDVHYHIHRHRYVMRIVFCLVEPMFLPRRFLVFRISWEYSPRFGSLPFLSFCLQHTFAYLLSTAKLKIMLPARLLYKNIKYFTRFQFQLLHANSRNSYSNLNETTRITRYE